MAGRPTDYKPEYAAQAEKLCKLGATDKELADFFEVCEDTVNTWKKAHNEFSVSVKAGKQLADANVAERLYERAMGFEHDSEEIKVVEGSIERVPIRKIYPPDTTAAIFWLKNRQKDKWRDLQRSEITGADGKDLNYTVTLDIGGTNNNITTIQESESRPGNQESLPGI